VSAYNGAGSLDGAGVGAGGAAADDGGGGIVEDVVPALALELSLAVDMGSDADTGACGFIPTMELVEEAAPPPPQPAHRRAHNAQGAIRSDPITSSRPRCVSVAPSKNDLPNWKRAVPGAGSGNFCCGCTVLP
jgi:hypothetical protein